MMKQTIPLVACLLLVPSSTIAAEAISPARIHAPSTTPPISTAAKILSDFLRSKGVELPILTEVAENDPPVAGTILLGTTADSPVLARWAREGRLQVSASESAGDWHHLRPAWSGPVLRSPLTIEALQTVALSGAEPPKPHGERAYAPYRDDIARSNALAPACGSPRITSARPSRTSGPHRHWCEMTPAPLSTTGVSRNPEENHLPYWHMVVDKDFNAEYQFRRHCTGHNVGT